MFFDGCNLFGTTFVSNMNVDGTDEGTPDKIEMINTKKTE